MGRNAEFSSWFSSSQATASPLVWTSGGILREGFSFTCLATLVSFGGFMYRLVVTTRANQTPRHLYWAHRSIKRIKAPITMINMATFKRKMARMHVLDSWQDKPVPFVQYFLLETYLHRNSCLLWCSVPWPALITTASGSGCTNKLPAKMSVLCRTWQPSDALNRAMTCRILRWHGSHSAEVNENINGYSQDQGYS